MGEVPDLPLAPEDIEGELTKEQNIQLGASFVILANYVEKELARCGTPAL